MRPPPLGISLLDLMETLKQVQYQAGLAVNSVWKGTNPVKLYEELGWESLSDRHYLIMSHRVLHLHKIVEEKTLHYFREKLPLNRNVVISVSSLMPNVLIPLSAWKNIITQYHHHFVN